MKLRLKTTDVESTLKAVFARMPTKKAVLTITAIDGKFILESGNNSGAVEVAIEREGQVSLPAKTFRKVLDTYTGGAELQIDGSAEGLKINAFKMPVASWNPTPARPPGF